MSRADYLKDQAARAERLARSLLDELTVSRLTKFAADCRAELAAITAPAQQAHGTS
jgi:hypothetical protein